MARALRSVLDPGHLVVVVNVGDDTERYGVRVSADPDTVLYTLAGMQGADGWGRANDTSRLMGHLSDFGIDTSFTLGDNDFALCVVRTMMLGRGDRLSQVTAHLARMLGVTDVTVIPATDDPLATFVQTVDGDWLDFQEYFVDRRHSDRVASLAYHGSTEAHPAPGVVEAIESADMVIIAPSNPPLSIWPILAIDDIRDAVARHRNSAAVSPLFGGTPLRGPADTVMRAVGLSAGSRGVLEAYDGLIDRLFIDNQDSDDTSLGPEFDVTVVPGDTNLNGQDNGATFARSMLAEMSL